MSNEDGFSDAAGHSDVSSLGAFTRSTRFALHTQNVVNIWNWKSAVMSAAYRAPIFFATSFKAGWRNALAAMLAETVFRAFTSGFWGAFTQAVRLMQPAWLAVVLVVLVAPVVVQSLNLLFHMMSGTTNLKQGFLISCVVTGLASLFNWYAMRNGAFVTGRQGDTLWHDLKQLPMIIAGFIAAGPIALWRLLKPAKPTVS